MAKVLVVDDEPDIRNSLVDLLETRTETPILPKPSFS